MKEAVILTFALVIGACLLALYASDKHMSGTSCPKCGSLMTINEIGTGYFCPHDGTWTWIDE